MNNLSIDVSDVFELDGTYYVIKKESYESREIHAERAFFILNKIKKIGKEIINDTELNKLIILSKITANVKLYGCAYSDNIMSLIKD